MINQKAFEELKKIQEENRLILEAIYTRAQEDFYTFCTLMSNEYDKKADMSFPTYKMSCEVLQAFIENRLYVKINNEYQRVDFAFYNACPSFGKSYLVTRLLSLWCFGKVDAITKGSPLEEFIISSNEKNREKIMTDIDLLTQLKIYKNIFTKFKDYKQYLLKNNQSNKVTVDRAWLNMNPARSDITGSRGNFFILDDFDKPTHIGRREFETSKQFLDMYLTRDYKNQISKTLVVQQRVNINDTTGYLTEILQDKIPYIQIKIPYKFTEDTKYSFYIKNKYTNEIELKEYEFKADTFSNPYFNEIEWNTTVLVKECQGRIEKRETQYQQNPTINTGALFTPDCFNQIPLQEIKDKKGFYVISCDPANKLGEHNDSTAFAIFKVVDETMKNGKMVAYLENMKTIKVDFVDLVEHCKQLDNTYDPYYFIIEDSVNGTGCIQELRSKYMEIPVVPCNRQGIQVERTSAQQRFKEAFANGIKMKMVDNTLIFPLDNDNNFMYDLKKEMFEFPNGKHDDRIDAISNFVYMMQKEFWKGSY